MYKIIRNDVIDSETLKQLQLLAKVSEKITDVIYLVIDNKVPKNAKIMVFVFFFNINGFSKIYSPPEILEPYKLNR